MSHIVANIALMFEDIEPCYVSGSQAELGKSAGRMTWENALRIASSRKRWLRTGVKAACEGMREWARSAGWEAEEIAAWSTDECIALFVQNVASELREHLDSDNSSWEECVAKYSRTDWDNEPSYPTGVYYARNGRVFVEYYTGC